MTLITVGFNPQQVRQRQAERIATAAYETVTASAPGLADVPTSDPYGDALARTLEAAAILRGQRDQRQLEAKAARILDKDAPDLSA